MAEETEKMIARLQKKLEPLEQEAIKIKKGINLLCELDGEPPLYAGIEDAPIIRTQLQGDEYHNMPQATAITEILERRKSVNLAPVTIDEIYEDLIAGGFQFMKGKNEAIQKRGLAIAMSKNRKFYKLPNEKWGIKSWYNIKETTQSSKSDTNGRSENESTEGTETEKGGNNEQSE